MHTLFYYKAFFNDDYIAEMYNSLPSFEGTELPLDSDTAADSKNIDGVLNRLKEIFSDAKFPCSSFVVYFMSTNFLVFTNN